VYTRPTEPRSIGGVLDDGLRLWRDSLPRTWPLALLAQLIVAMPFVVLAYKFPGLFPAVPTPISATKAANVQALLALFMSPATWLTYLVITVFSVACYSAIVLMIASVADNTALSLGGSLSAALRLLGRLVAQFLLFVGALLVVAIAFALLAGFAGAFGGSRAAGAIFGIVLFLLFVFVFGRVFLASMVLILDDAGPAQSIAISWRLSRYHWWRCAAILTVLFIIVLVFSLVVSFLTVSIGAAFGSATLLVALVSQILGLLVNSLLGSLFPAALISILYDLKLRKQGGDLLGRVDALARQ